MSFASLAPVPRDRGRRTGTGIPAGTAHRAPTRGRTNLRPGRGATTLATAWCFAGTTVTEQIAYPLVHGNARNDLSIATVLTFTLATLSGVAATRGVPRGFALLAIAGGLGFGAEVLGVCTGVPFGHYTYSGQLGVRVAAVPLIVPLAWTMMAWPALVAARHLCRGRVAVPLIAGFALASWDLFLDPQMVADGNWRWLSHSAALHGIPWTNAAGWLAVGVVMSAALDRALPRTEDDQQALPLTLFLWTYAGSVVANAVFLGRPGVALSGGLGMGLVALPLAAGLRPSARRLRLVPLTIR